MATNTVLAAGQASKLIRREEVAEGTIAFHFEKPTGFNFKAGQFADVTLTDPPETDTEGNTRTFSIASPPFENELVFTTRMRDTAFKRSLKKLPLTTEVKIGSAAGSFTLHKNPAKPAVLLAGGIGITPFLSIVRQAHHDRLPHKLYLFYVQSTARRRTFPGHSAEHGEDEYRLPLDLYHDRNVEVQKGMERRDSSDRPRDAIQAFGHTAGPHLLHCRTARHGCRHEGDACEGGH
jgi:ferredoxin-NADP reductase